jgi:hypothetical protein
MKTRNGFLLAAVLGIILFGCSTAGWADDTPPKVVKQPPTAEDVMLDSIKAAYNADSSAPAPKIFFPEMVHDFGPIGPGASVSYTFKVVNQGNAPLLLIKAKGS